MLTAAGLFLVHIGHHRRANQIRWAVVTDGITRVGLQHEAAILDLAPLTSRVALKLWRPEVLLVESAWEGFRQSWKYGIASYPDHPERNNQKLRDLVAHAKDLGIPTVFWNKEDAVHFERFIESASLFDHIFTVDENCVPRYRERVPDHVTVDTLMFSVQPRIHRFTGIRPTQHRANFVGSYNRAAHDERRELQHMLFESAARWLGLTVYDRHSDRKAQNYRYPDHIEIDVRPAVPYTQTASIYKEFLVSLNVNTVRDSPTMFSRRLVEIIGCGGLAVTTPALSVDRMFSDYCYTVRSAEEADELFARLKHDGLSPQDRERMAAGADYVAKHHTWAHRLRQILDVVRGSRSS
jgi:spore maturation protein CgeB